MDCVVGELDEHRIERLDQHIDRERARDRGKTECQASKRMPPHAHVGDARQRDQNQIARIRTDARE